MASRNEILPDDPLVVVAMKTFAQQIANQDAVQMQEMTVRWLKAEANLHAAILELSEEIEEEKKAGNVISASMLFKMDRYEALLDQAEAEFNKYANEADDEISLRQLELANQGITHAVQATVFSSYPNVPAGLTRLPIEAVENMIGNMGDGTPLGKVLRLRLAKDANGVVMPFALAKINDTFIQASLEGWNPRDTALAIP